jgi:hypothetical protein
MDTTAPTKTSRNEGQRSARSAPNTLSLKSQIETIYPTASVTLIEDSPQPPSPSPATKKDGPILLTDRTPQQTSTPSTPTDIFRADTLAFLPPGEDDDAITQINEEQPTPTSIRDRLAAAEERGDTVIMNRTNFRDALDKYTNGEMEDVHYNHPMAALRNIDLNVIGSWEEIQSGKLLAQPFGPYASKVENHSALKALIFAAVVEITKAANVSVCAPRRSPTAERNPTSFLIHNLTEKQRQTLLTRRTWSSTSITFRVVPLEPKCPNFLFSIKGFTTQTTETVHNAVKEVWNDAATETFLNGICNQVPEKNRAEANKALYNFIQSMWVTMLDTRNRGNILAPTFRVYAIGETINEDNTWCQLRSYLATRDYMIPFEDPGLVMLPSAECSLCHGADHPRGLCPFPLIPGWNGPTRRDDPPLIDPTTGRRGNEFRSNRDRNRARFGQN